MNNYDKNLATSLQVLKRLQDEGHVVFHGTDELSRTHLERLIAAGFLTEVIRGWYIIDNPENNSNTTVAWFSNYWKFISIYERYSNGEEWCLSPEQSIDICAGNTTIPTQITIYVSKGGNRVINLLHNTSIFEIRKSSLPDNIITIKETGVNIWPLESAIANVSVTYWDKDPDAIRICLNSIRNTSLITSALLDCSGHAKAGKVINALRSLGRTVEADNMERTLKRFNFRIDSSKDVFVGTEKELKSGKIASMWKKMRQQVIDSFDKHHTGTSIEEIEEKYKEDAYHSLSIEGYVVTQELIDRVSSGKWNPKGNKDDEQQKNALAARGYYQAFQKVKETIMKIKDKNLNPGQCVESDFMDWYVEMWQPFVATGILKHSDIIGYRNRPVYIKNSRHVPPASHKVLDYMDEYFECLKNEEYASVRAVLGHFFLTWIHPFNDGNGRMARFVMNAMLTTGGYSWTVIPVSERNRYMTALEKASVEDDITDFSKLVAEL